MSVARSSAIVSFFTVTGLGLGILSNTAIAMKFGAGAEMDVYLAATTLPFFINSILGGVLNFTFIPVFAEYREKDRAGMWELVSGFINLFVLGTAAACLLLALFALPVMRFTVHGFSPEKLAQGASLMRLLLPVCVLTAANELMSSVYYSSGRFAAPSLYKVISPALTILYVFLFHDALSTRSLALAVLSSALIQAAVLAFGFFRNPEFRYAAALNLDHPGMRRVFGLMTPLALGMLVYRAVPVFDRYFLSALPAGSISHVVYAVKLSSIIPSVIGSGIALSVFPLMSRYAAARDFNALRNIMSKGIRMLFFLCAPVAVLLAVFGLPVIRLLFERGRFTPADTAAVYHAFLIYLLALPAMTIGQVIGQGYYVLKEMTLSALIGVAEMALYIVLCLFFLPRLGYLAVPVAFASYMNAAAAASALIVRRKVGNIGGATVAGSVLRHLAAALAAAAPALLFSWKDLPPPLALPALALCFAVYFLIAAFVLPTEEAADVLRHGRSFLEKRGLLRPGGGGAAA